MRLCRAALVGVCRLAVAGYRLGGWGVWGVKTGGVEGVERRGGCFGGKAVREWALTKFLRKIFMKTCSVFFLYLCDRLKKS